MYTIYQNIPRYKDFLIKGIVPSKDQHKQLAEQFAAGGYDSLSFSPGVGRDCPKCTIDFIEHYSGLKELQISACNIVDIHSIPDLQLSIKSLRWGKSSFKKDLSFLESLKDLEYFSIYGASVNAHAISSLSGLLSLDISAIDAYVIKFKHLKKLAYLYISHNCKNIDRTDISELVNLKGLSFIFMTNLADFSFMSSLRGLVGASFVWVPKLNELPDLSELNQLKTLEFDTCKRLMDPGFVNTSRSIENLLALNCNIAPYFLTPLQNHLSLQRVCISFNSKKKKQEVAKMLGDKYMFLSQQLFKYEVSPTFVKKIDPIVPI